MSTAMDNHSAPPSVYLHIGTPQEKEDFLKEIQPDFLEKVEPWESGLLDQMIADGLLTETDRESLSGKTVKTPRDLRRKLWFLLNGLSVSELKTKVFPKLYQDFPHIIPERFLAKRVGGQAETILDDVQGKECLRHEIMRKFRLGTVIDKMYQYDCFNLDEYRRCSMGGCSVDQLWPMLFNKCAASHSNLFCMMKDLLEMHRMPVPPDLTSLLSRGIPCTCQQVRDLLPSTPSSLCRKKIESWMMNSPVGLNRQSSGSSARSTQSSSVYSINSQLQVPESESEVNSADSMVHCSGAALPAPPGVWYKKTANSGWGKGSGKVDALSGFRGNEWPHVSVTASCSGPSAQMAPQIVPPNSGNMDATVLIRTAPSRRVKTTVIPIGDGPNLRDDALRVGGSVIYAQRMETEGSFSSKFMSAFSEIRKFLQRHYLITILLFGFLLLANVAMNGLHVFQLNHEIDGSIEHNWSMVNKALVRQSELLENLTSRFDEYITQNKITHIMVNTSET